MKLNKFLKGRDRALFAAKVGTTKNYLNMLACGARRASSRLALRIEAESNGAVSLYDLFAEPLKQKKGTAGGVIPSHITHAPI
jgi:hypothetical protein